jgi:predicted outer membrane repeat protein
MIMKKAMVFLFLLIGGFIFLNAQSTEKSFFVKATGNDGNNGRTEAAPFKTLQKAVEVASQSTIKRITVIGTLNNVSEGDCNDGFVFKIEDSQNEKIIITGKENPLKTERAVLSAMGTNKGVIKIINGTETTIRFENIEISGANCSSIGAGINSEWGNIEIGKGTKIINNKTSFYGGGLRLGVGSCLIEENTEISNNSAEEDGGGIYSDSNGNTELTILGGKISNNITLKSGGGIYIIQAKNLKISGGEITENNAKLFGGGIYIHWGSLTIENGNFKANFAKLGGSIYCKEITLSVINTSILGSKANLGAGIYLMNLPKKENVLQLQKCNFSENKAEFVGGAIYVDNDNSECNSYQRQFYWPNENDFLGCIYSGNVAGDGEGENLFFKKAPSDNKLD